MRSACNGPDGGGDVSARRGPSVPTCAEVLPFMVRRKWARSRARGTVVAAHTADRHKQCQHANMSPIVSLCLATNVYQMLVRSVCMTVPGVGGGGLIWG